eukprot:GEZU01013131.1.p1 GENE.GEZU01013131.1~~GEZU01013131.1.p1  ORF type:complete len:245 (+),score=29.69 GEZU01013131.1:193-927(+)
MTKLPQSLTIPTAVMTTTTTTTTLMPTTITILLTPLIHSFESMELDDMLCAGIYAYGFEKPSKVQKRAIIPLLRGFDVVLQAQSGTGKTCAFAIALLQRINLHARDCQALVLTASRELANQTQRLIAALGERLEGPRLECHACVGGTTVRADIDRLHAGVHVVVATPGRAYDMMNRRALRTDTIRLLMLDEADELYSRGYGAQILNIFKFLPMSQIQVAISSCTMTPELLAQVDLITKSPIVCS